MLALPLSLLLTFAAPDTCHPPEIFASVRAATGGDRWQTAGGILGDGEATSAGLKGPAHLSLDLRTGRSLQRITPPMVAETDVYDGRTHWIVNGEGGVHPLDSPDATAGARTDAYLTRNGYFSPVTDRAGFACQPQQTVGSRSFDVVRVTPRGGRPVDIWIDRQSHRIARTVQRTPTLSTISTYADYRHVDGLVLPFVLTTADDDGSDTVVLRLSKYSVVPVAHQADFVRPPEPTNFRMNGGAASTTVPISLDNAILTVHASINGKGPFPFVLDTGGHAILTLDGAAALGLTPIGNSNSGGGGEGKTSVQFVQTQSIRIGDAEITHIPMTVLGIHADGLGPPSPGDAPRAGILGLEVFERFAVRIDYLHKTLTLTPLSTFHYNGNGVALPLFFQEDEPLIAAQADGVDGLFGIDTGNSGPTVLFGHFLEQHGFFDRYRGGIDMTSSGAGGIVHNSIQTLDRLTIAGQTMHNFLTSFVVQKRGSFSALTEAGNIGNIVLSQFTPTFDYRDEKIYFEREPNAQVDIQNRAGFGAAVMSGNLVVTVVLPKTPATEAAIVAGDRIVSINGTPGETIAPDALRALLRGPVGTTITLRIVHDKTSRDVALVLRDLFCPTSPQGCAPSVEPARP